jgi:HTH-type transcriptional regulator / antitoxin HigA
MNFQPNWASPPGNTIKDILSERKISISGFAEKIGENSNYVYKLIDGKISIDIKVAVQLMNTLGASKDFWLKREREYRNSLKRIQESNLWLKSLPVKDMLRNGWISQAENLMSSCFSFFDVNNIEEWNSKYEGKLSLVDFRQSKSFVQEKASILTWLRQGELVADKINCKSWNKNLFIEKLDHIKKLTRVKNPAIFLPKLIDICSDCGIALSIVPTPLGCSASGATFFIKDEKPVIILSFRYLSDDQFWFTFFHEAGHLILHSYEDVHIEFDRKNLNQKANNQSEKEKEANIFAGEVLIPFSMREEMKKIRGNKRRILDFASSAGVSPGIVIGQLQHLGIIKFGYLNGYKRRYNWEEIKNTLSM